MGFQDAQLEEDNEAGSQHHLLPSARSKSENHWTATSLLISGKSLSLNGHTQEDSGTKGDFGPHAFQIRATK